MQTLSALKNTNWHAPSLAYSFTGKFVVLENSKTTWPLNSGSIGVTFTIIPQRAYVLFPTQITIISFGILNVSTVLAKAKLFGGKTTYSFSFTVFVTKLSFEKFLGSIILLFIFVKIFWQVFQQMVVSFHFCYFFLLFQNLIIQTH